MKITKYFTIYFILILTHGLSQSVTIGQNLMPPMPLDGIEELDHVPLTKYDNSASDSLYDDFLSNIIVNSNSRDGGGVYTFTTCGQSGRFGPSQNQANAAYSGSNISVTVNNGIQEWTVPATGNYVIEAYGARGGNGAQYAVGDHGEGAYVKGTFALNEGDKLQILVGQEGSYDNYSRYGGGGGGGSFVAQGTSYGNATPLIIAGGGGGGGYNSGSYVDGQTGNSGSNGGDGSRHSYNGPGIGGSNGMGATGSTYGGNAGGFYSNGSGNYNYYSEAGVGFRNGGNGGNGQYGGRGGFGGGAGGYGGAGGAGGYSGGGGGAWSYGGAGGGGGSYNGGASPTNLSGLGESHGVVIIALEGVDINHVPVAHNQAVSGNEDESQTITLTGADVDGGTLTFMLDTYTSNGSISLDGDVVSYIPNSNYNGTDHFSFKVSDGELTSSAANVDIDIIPVNDLPVFNSMPQLNTVENHEYHYSIEIHDVDGDMVSVTAPNKPDWLNISDQNSSSLYFNGGDRVTVPYSENQDIVDAMTIEAWIMIDRYQDYGAVITKGDFTGSNGWSEVAPYSLMQGYGGYMRLAYNWNGSPSGNFFTNSTIPLDTWTHVACVVESNGNGYFYINGNLDATYNFGSNFEFYNNDEALVIGADPPGNTEWWYGNLDDIRLWNTSRTADQINVGMNQSIDPNQDGLVAYWNFNEGSGNEIHDITGNGNHGTINGANWSTSVAYTSAMALSGTPTFNDGGLHNIQIIANDGNGGYATQDFNIAVAVTHLNITGESGFRILSSPVSGAIFGDLLEELWTQGSEGSDHEGAEANVWTYDDGWVPVADLYNDELQAGQGFVVYVFADTDFDGDDDLPVTLNVDGEINETDISVTANPTKWNLVGNPYGLHVNINQMLSDNSSKFHSTVYRLDDDNPGYRTHNGTVGDIDQGLIKPFDGFWVQADNDGDVFEFTEQSIRKGQINGEGGGRSTTNESTGTATFTFTNGEFTSNVYLSFTESGHINLDPADAKQIIPISPAEHLTSMIHESGKSLSINNLPSDLTTDISFDLDVMLLSPNDEGYETQSEQVTMTWDVSDLPEGISLSLVNNGTGQTVNLYGYPSMNVALPSKGGFSFPENLMETYPSVGESQFTLSVYTDIASNDDENIILPEDITLHNAYPNPFNPSTVISFDIAEMGDVSLKIFDLTGRQVASLINEFMIPGSHQITWNPSLLPSGVYLVELVVGDRSFNQKITYIK